MKKTIEIEAYKDPKGRPTCAKDFEKGEFCKLLTTYAFGTRYICGFLEEEAFGYESDFDFLKPCEGCPIWKDEL
jgi:hypothetical protein